MKPAFEDMNLQIPTTATEPEDYTGEDGLLYCGKCRTPKEAFFPAGPKQSRIVFLCVTHWQDMLFL